MENIDEVLLRVAHDREGVAWGWSKRCEPFRGQLCLGVKCHFKVGNADRVHFRCSCTNVCFHLILGAAPKIPIKNDIQDLINLALVMSKQWNLSVTGTYAFELQSGMINPELCTYLRF